MPGPVVIVDYDPEWPKLFEVEKKSVLKAVGPLVLAVEHIGSTAVPGLGAKPIIDMMAGVRSKVDAEKCLEPLRRIGYYDVTPIIENDEWFYCMGKPPHSVGFHLHLVKFMSDHWVEHIVFRDYLRTHADTAQRYYELKKRLSLEYCSDREGYTNARSAFIESVLAHARCEGFG